MGRRAVLLLMVVVAALVVASGVALAANIKCPNRSGNLCVGTNKKDTMTGTKRIDEMRGRGGDGNDLVLYLNDKHKDKEAPYVA